MSTGWDGLPLLPLRCILEHLTLDDALAAMSTCRHWRSAVLVYEGHRETLKLRAKQLEKNLFLTRLFRKHARKLHIYIDCNEDELNKFMNFVLPQFFDPTQLKEVVFIGPTYIQQNALVPSVKLKRVILESLVFKHSKVMQRLAVFGCEIGPVKNENDRYVHKQVELYSKPLSFNPVTSPIDAILSRSNADIMAFSTLKHIIFEYEYLTTESLETLSQLNNLRQLSLNIVFNKQKLTAIDWATVNNCFTKGLDVAVNLISVPHKKFKPIMENVLVEGLPLTSLKVFFCKTVSFPLISHVCRLYNSTLRELVWVDTPHDGNEASRIIRLKPGEVVYVLRQDYNQINPFILLCWRCINLQRLVIHGYWLWQYDILGFVRLRKSLRMELSSVFGHPDKFNSRQYQIVECGLRVLSTDPTAPLDSKYVQEINQYTEAEWKPIPWRRLHPGLRNHSTPDKRGDYIVKEVLQPWGVT